MYPITSFRSKLSQILLPTCIKLYVNKFSFTLLEKFMDNSHCVSLTKSTSHLQHLFIEQLLVLIDVEKRRYFDK
jgi:hypothetical protein